MFIVFMYIKSELCVENSMLLSENKAAASDSVSYRRLTSGSRFIAKEMTG